MKKNSKSKYKCEKLKCNKNNNAFKNNTADNKDKIK